MVNIPKVFLRDSVSQVADIQCRHQFILGNIKLRHTVIAPHQLLSYRIIDAEKSIFDVLIGQWVVWVRRLLMSIHHTHIHCAHDMHFCHTA